MLQVSSGTAEASPPFYSGERDAESVESRREKLELTESRRTEARFYVQATVLHSCYVHTCDRAPCRLEDAVKYAEQRIFAPGWQPPSCC